MIKSSTYCPAYSETMAFDGMYPILLKAKAGVTVFVSYM